MQTVCKDLFTFCQSEWTDNDIFIILAIPYCTSAYGNVGLAFAYLKTTFVGIGALLIVYDFFPFQVFSFY